MPNGESSIGQRPRMAVIGSGVAGLTSAYLLRRRYDVTLFEADGRLGGHAHTHDITDRSGRDLAIDTGFIVHNERTYPHLLKLFAELGVATQPTEMSMSVRCLGCGLEYAGAKGPRGMFAQRGSAFRGRYLATIAQVPRFHRRARALLIAGTGPSAGADPGPTLGEFLREGHFTSHFINHFAVPLVSAVWSCGPELVADYPARYLFRFLDQHGMLTVTGSPSWRTVTGGSRTYVERAVKELAAVRTSTAVRTIQRHADGIDIRSDDDQVEHFAGAVVATHPDQALRVLAAPTNAERTALGAFRYSRNPTVLHTDTSVLPTAAGALASWNYTLPACRPAPGAVRVSYDLTRLQQLPTRERFIVTLGDRGDVPEDRVVRRMDYEHPIYTPESVAAQPLLPGLARDGLAFAGAYHGWGFHEDGCRSGVEAARAFGVEP